MIKQKKEWICSKCNESFELKGRVCGSCKQDKEINEFYHDSKGNPRTYCIDCTKEKSRLHQEEIQNYVNSIKASNPCVDCGEFYPSYVMQFDHVSGKKYANVSKMTGYTLEKVIHEINQCDLVCANCHALRTFSRKPPNNYSDRRLLWAE